MKKVWQNSIRSHETMTSALTLIDCLSKVMIEFNWLIITSGITLDNIKI